MRFNLQLLILLLVVTCGTFAAGYYMLKIPAFVESLYDWLGWVPPPRRTGYRQSWLVFLMFTYTAPIAIAMVMYGLSGMLRWYVRRQKKLEAELPDSPFD